MLHTLSPRASSRLSFLIDECLHHTLVAVANEAGYVAQHIEHLGLKGHPDWRLLDRALDADAIFVTNNARDFLKLYSATTVHSGLIVILPTVKPLLQRELFLAALHYLVEKDDMVNRVLEVDFVDGRPNVYDFALP